MYNVFLFIYHNYVIMTYGIRKCRGTERAALYPLRTDYRAGKNLNFGLLRFFKGFFF